MARRIIKTKEFRIRTDVAPQESLLRAGEEIFEDDDSFNVREAEEICLCGEDHVIHNAAEVIGRCEICRHWICRLCDKVICHRCGMNFHSRCGHTNGSFALCNQHGRFTEWVFNTFGVNENRWLQDGNQNDQ